MKLPKTIEPVSVETLIPYARNSRTHSDAQVAQIAASIKEFGFTNPVLIDQGVGIIAGHGRVLAARKLGLPEVPCIRLGHLTDAQKRAYVLADNKLALNAGWDTEMLKVEFADLQELGFDLDLIGFSDDELADLLGDIEEAESDNEDKPIGEPVDEDIPDAPATPVSQPGDIWQLGVHRLICGDSTDPAVVAALMAGDTARLCFTSPPYGQQRDYTQGIADWDALMRGVFANLPMAPEGQVLVNLGLIHRDNEVIPYWDGWLSWMRQQGWRRFAWYVWDQGAGMPGNWQGRLAPSFEFVFHFNHQARQPNKIVPCACAGSHSHLRKDGTSPGGMRKQDGSRGGWQHEGVATQDTKIPDAVLRINRHCGKIGQNIDHPAVFPVKLPQHVIETYTDTGEIVFEPFCGSGTTILAAQKTGRQVRAIELAPEYVDVTIKRFQQNFPEVPVTLITTGQSFDDVAKERLATTEAEQ